MTTKDYLIKTSYDNAGMTQFKQDCETAAGAAKFMGASISADARLVNQSVTTGFNAAGQAVRNVTSIFNDQGKITKVVFQDMGNSIKMVSQQAQTFGTVAGTLSGQLENVVGRALIVAPAWLAIRAAMTAVIEVFQSSVSFMVEWQTQLARIQLVTGATKEQVDVLSNSLLALSEKFGISTKDIGETANEWLRMGANMSTVIPLLEQTSKLSLISGKSMEESAKSINILRSAFTMNAEDVSNSIDKLIGIQSASGVSLEVLLEGFDKASIKAHQMGVSFDQLAGYIAAVNEKSRQGGEAIGTQLNMMFNRLGTNAVQLAQNLSGVSFYLDSTGKATSNTTSQMRNTNDILKDLAANWNNLSNTQQNALAKTLGSARQVTTFIALMQNFNAAVKASGTSTGEAGNDLSKVTGTVENKIKQLQGAWGAFVNSVNQTGVMQTVLDNIKQRVEAITIAINAGHAAWDFLFNRSEFNKKIAAFKDLEAAKKKALSIPAPGGEVSNTPENVGTQLNTGTTEQEIKLKIQQIERQALLTRQDSLATTKEELVVLGNGITIDGKDLRAQVQSLTIKKEKLEVEKEIERLTENQTVIEAQLKTEGASQLQIDIAHLAYLQAINASTKEISAQQDKVTIATEAQYKTVQDDIITALLTEQKTLGETALQQIQNKIALEDQLGIHLQGVDLLKQQLELYKAISDENKKTPRQRQEELLNLIKKTPSPERPGFATTFRNEQEESRLTKEALTKGISRDVIDAILHPNTKSTSGGFDSLQDELKRGLSDPLNVNIANLAHTISNLAEAITRPTGNLDLTSAAHYKNPEAPITTAQGQNIPSYAQSFRGRDVQVDLGGVHVTVHAHTKTELKNELSRIMQEMIANHMVHPDSKMNQAIKKVVDQF